MSDGSPGKDIKDEAEETTRLCLPNGRNISCEQYDGEFSDCNVIPEMLQILEGKPIAQQTEYYYVTESHRFYSTAYGEITKENLHEYAKKLCDYDGVRALLTKDGILIGAKIKAMWSDEGKLFRKRPVCTYYASDNEGSGTKEREDYAFLMFVGVDIPREAAKDE